MKFKCKACKGDISIDFMWVDPSIKNNPVIAGCKKCRWAGKLEDKQIEDKME